MPPDPVSPRVTTRPVARRLLLLACIAATATFLVPGAGAQPMVIDRDQAVERVTTSVLGGSLDGVRVHVLPRPVAAGETIETWHREVYTARTTGWLVFIDRHPGANWEHPCWYVQVDAMTGAIERHAATTPPLLLPELVEVTDGRDNPPPGVSEAALERFSEQLRRLPHPTPRTGRGQAYAFLISGGANQSNNHIRYWNDCAFIYRALVEYYGYADDHIRVCISDGTDPAPDRSNGTNSPADLDGDGDPDIEYPATLQFIDQVFGELAATLTADDQLFLFTTDHGGQESGQDCYLNLWNFEELRDDQLAAHIAALPCETIVCTFEQCYSGGMIDDLEGDGRVIATAAAWNELSWAMAPDYIYDAFVYHWTCAVGWATPAGNPVDADTNNDDIVSIHEAFLYAEAHDQADETPQYSSTPAQLGDALNLFGNLEGVYLTLDAVSIDDDASGASQGNGNGLIEFGETIELTVALHNMGLTDAYDVTGNLATLCPYVTLLVAGGSFGTIPAGGTVSNDVPFVVGVASGVPDGEPLELDLAISESPHLLDLDLVAAAPVLQASVSRIDDSSGDGDGQADPGEDVIATLRIENLGGAATPALSAVLSGGGYFTVDPTPSQVEPIAAGASTTAGGFAISIAPECPELTTGQLALDLTAAGSYATATDVFLMVGPWFDSAEVDLGWTLGTAGDDATSGIWERVDPIGTIYNSQAVQPEDDHTAEPGHLCFVTGNGTIGGAAGENDVDNGKTTLLSPVFDLDGAASATISYWRWYTNDLGNNPGEDTWDVDVTADGLSWVHLEHTTASANTWTEHSFDLAPYIPFTAEVQFRFVASDVSPGSLVEAAVDDILVSIQRPPSAGLATAGVPQVHRLALGPCVPNPVTPRTRIPFELPEAGPVTVAVYNVTGRAVAVLLDATRLEAGRHAVSWDGRTVSGQPLASGVYYIRLDGPGGERSERLTLLR